MSIKKGILNIPTKTGYEITEGDLWSGITLSPKDESQNAIDLSSYAIRMQIKSRNNDILIDISNGNGIVVTATSVTISPFKAPRNGNHKYDIQFTPQGSVDGKTWIKGVFKVEKQTTIA